MNIKKSDIIIIGWLLIVLLGIFINVLFFNSIVSKDALYIELILVMLGSIIINLSSAKSEELNARKNTIFKQGGIKKVIVYVIAITWVITYIIALCLK